MYNFLCGHKIIDLWNFHELHWADSMCKMHVHEQLQILVTYVTRLFKCNANVKQKKKRNSITNKNWLTNFESYVHAGINVSKERWTTVVYTNKKPKLLNITGTKTCVAFIFCAAVQRIHMREIGGQLAIDWAQVMFERSNGSTSSVQRSCMHRMN